MAIVETFSVITVQVRIFSGLDRNYLKYSLRICEIFLFMNAKVLFLVICLASAILCDTSFGHIRRSLRYQFGRSRHEKKIIKKNATQNLNHGPSYNLWLSPVHLMANLVTLPIICLSTLEYTYHLYCRPLI